MVRLSCCNFFFFFFESKVNVHAVITAFQEYFDLIRRLCRPLFPSGNISLITVADTNRSTKLKKSDKMSA